MRKKIYCAGPISGDLTYKDYYIKIIDIVKSLGHIPLHEPELKPNYVLSDREIFNRDINWLTNSDGMIAEVSGPSLGVGFEIAYALYVLQKPVLALCHKNVPRLSAMIRGCNSSYLSVQTYNDEVDLNKFIQIYLSMIIK